MRPYVKVTEEFVQQRLGAETTGHDHHHVFRVRDLALRICREERAEPLVTELGALLHDIDDFKFSGNVLSGGRLARSWLEQCRAPPQITEYVGLIVDGVSFKGANVEQEPLSLEGMCVQDADRLDAIGMVGVARACAYGGANNRPLYVPGEKPVLHASAEEYLAAKGSTINHFFEKLLLLKDRMNTATGKRIAEGRHKDLIHFLDRFIEQWYGRDA